MAIYLPVPRPDSHSPCTWRVEHPLGSSCSGELLGAAQLSVLGLQPPGEGTHLPTAPLGTGRGHKPCPGPGWWELLCWQPSSFHPLHPPVFPGDEPWLPVTHQQGKLRRPNTVSPDGCASSCLSFISLYRAFCNRGVFLLFTATSPSQHCSAFLLGRERRGMWAGWLYHTLVLQKAK